jgi:nicotinate-nucleotide adenylyltransferase
MNEHRIKLGFIGGLFDPIHLGHLSLCIQAHMQLGLDKVLFIPSFHPPHKVQTTSYEHRMNMVKQAILDFNGFEISDIESEIKGPSYTVKTIRKLIDLYPGSEIFFIIGEDNITSMEEWYKPEEIFKYSKVVMGNRPGETPKSNARFNDMLVRISIPPMNISSTEIRKAVHENRSIDNLVPDVVSEYIAREGLYV